MTSIAPPSRLVPYPPSSFLLHLPHSLFLSTMNPPSASASAAAASLHSMKALVLRSDPSSQDLSDADFMRFLRARDYDTKKAAKFMLQHIQWRRSFLPHGHVKEEEIAKELQRKQLFMQGHDKHGCSIVVLLTARHRAFERNLEEIKRLFVYTFDKAAACNIDGQEKFVIIGDLAGWGVKNLDIRGYISVLDILQNHYPERLRKLYLVHLPYLFWKVWKIMYPLIDENTKSKVILVENDNLAELLSEDVEKDQLPTMYGGTLDLVPVQDAKL